VQGSRFGKADVKKNTGNLPAPIVFRKQPGREVRIWKPRRNYRNMMLVTANRQPRSSTLISLKHRSCDTQLTSLDVLRRAEHSQSQDTLQPILAVTQHP
jgi:hypothetical protein